MYKFDDLSGVVDECSTDARGAASIPMFSENNLQIFVV